MGHQEHNVLYGHYNIQEDKPGSHHRTGLNSTLNEKGKTTLDVRCTERYM